MTIQLDRYEIVEKIGQGGMAEVFKAMDRSMHRYVALKVLRAERCTDPWYRKRFIKEAKAMGQFSHPNIVSVYDVGEVDGRPFIVMELVESRSLEEELETGRKFSGVEIFDIARQLATALHAAHDCGVIHRDIKPGNIFWSEHNHTARLSDFGIAHVAQSRDTITTQQGELLGTPQYMAPEVLAGNNTDVRSDLYALGIVLYQLVTGRRAFDSANLANLVYKISHEEPTPILTLAPQAPKNLVALIEKLIQKNPHRRFANAAELLKALDQIAKGNTPKEPANSLKSIKLGITGGAAVLALGVVFFIYNNKESATTSVVSDVSVPQKAPQDLVKLIEGKLPAFECAKLGVSAQDGESVIVSGHVSREEDLMRLMETVDTLPEVRSAMYQVDLIAKPFCKLLALIERGNQGSVPEFVSGQDESELVLVTPNFPAFLYVDWYSHDGRVRHLYPRNARENAVLSAQNQLSIGRIPAETKTNDPENSSMLVVMATEKALTASTATNSDEYIALLESRLSQAGNYAVSYKTFGLQE